MANRLLELRDQIPSGNRCLSLVRSRWPRGLRRGSVATRLLELRDQIPSGNGCLSLLRDVCFRAEFSAVGRSRNQGSHTEYGVSK